MSDAQNHGTIVFLEEGVTFLGVVGDDKVRVAVYRDTRNGVDYLYGMDFHDESGWEPVFRVRDKWIQVSIDLLTQAKQLVTDSSPDADE